jgi:hypothetical protein
MFKSTNSFLKKVYKGKVADIDIQNYIYIITIEHDPFNLFKLQKDVDFFVYLKINELESNITPENWTEKIDLYESKGENVPMKTHINYIHKSLNERNNNKDLIEEDTYFDTEKIFYEHDLFCIRALQNYIKSLISQSSTNETIKVTIAKHENIFCNNGFVLFEYILTNHIAEKRGRINDISFYYWKMYNDKYIIQKPFVFVEWFMNVYNVDNFQIKTLETATDRHRPTHYSNALDWFKLQNH